jgi:phospholipase/carboxylesterase
MITRLADLDVQVFQHIQGPPRSAVILCHGFGAPGDDLVPVGTELAEGVAELGSTRFYFPAAPLSLGGGGLTHARAWWMIDFETIERLQANDPDALRVFREKEPEGMAHARSMLLKLVDEVSIATKLPMDRILLGGFSQGAMLATDVALRLAEAPAGLAVLSGTLLLSEHWRTKAAARAGLPVFQSHGRQDPLLPFSAAESLHALFVEAKFDAEFWPFDGGHTISLEIMTKLAKFAVRVLTPRP